MKIITLKNKFKMNVAIVWFCDNIKTIKNKYDVLNLKGYNKPINGAINELQFSLVLDLLQDEDNLFSSIKKNVKYEINRCYKENIGYRIYDSKFLENNSDILNNFEKVYNQMYSEKNMNNKLSMSLVKHYINNDAFIITAASIDGKDLVYHAYVADDKNTRLLYSCSTFRSNEQEERNLIARANKFLHWEDIKYFKEQKIEKYDFGGIHSFDEPNGIDKFKMSFGGEKVEYYNVSYGNSFFGKLFIKFKNILKK